MQLNPYVHFDGRCEEAFKFYQQTLGGKIEMLLKYEGMPSAEHVPADWRSKIGHAHLTVGDQVFMGCDAPPSCYQKPQGFSASIQVKDPNEAERIFRELSQDGSIRMPIQETFWAARFGMLTDRYGIPWMVNCGKEA